MTKPFNANPKANFTIKVLNITSAKKVVSVGKTGNLTQAEAEMLADYNRAKFQKEEHGKPKAFKRDPSVWAPRHHDHKGRALRTSEFYSDGRIDLDNNRQKVHDYTSTTTTRESARVSKPSRKRVANRSRK